jgi:predicted acetyltransferase
MENKNPIYLAALFLLTADDKLWNTVRNHINLDCFDFKSMHLKGINADVYDIYQMSRTIYTAKEYIKLDEIADKNLIGDEAFMVIINSILIAKYGAAISQVKC